MCLIGPRWGLCQTVFDSLASLAQPSSCLEESSCMVGTKADEQPFCPVMNNNNICCLWRTGYTQHREQNSETGLSGAAGEQCRRAAARFYGLGSCSQPPPPGPSSFLRCTVVYTWATMNHVCWKKRGSTMKQWERVERGASVKHVLSPPTLIQTFTSLFEVFMWCFGKKCLGSLQLILLIP